MKQEKVRLPPTYSPSADLDKPITIELRSSWLINFSLSMRKCHEPQPTEDLLSCRQTGKPERRCHGALHHPTCRYEGDPAAPGALRDQALQPLRKEDGPDRCRGGPLRHRRVHLRVGESGGGKSSRFPAAQTGVHPDPLQRELRFLLPPLHRQPVQQGKPPDQGFRESPADGTGRGENRDTCLRPRFHFLSRAPQEALYARSPGRQLPDHRPCGAPPGIEIRYRTRGSLRAIAYRP